MNGITLTDRRTARSAEIDRMATAARQQFACARRTDVVEIARLA